MWTAYHPVSLYPTVIDIDDSAYSIDEEITYYAFDLEVLPERTSP